ncbi:MAG: aldo/keto reductase [bacterium]|nr:aldo/keto reductase [bacterium]
MDYVPFGNTGMKVSRLCVGSMTFGGRLDFESSARVVDEALDRGINFIDTADSYGSSEETLGRILSQEKREKVYLATKVFRQLCRDKQVGRNSRVNIIHSLERSLRLLNTDYVDLYQLHHPDPDTPIQETLETLDSLVKQGKVRHVGVSNHYAWQMAYMLGESKANGWSPLVSIQANHSILDRQVEMETVPFCDRFNIAMMCYSPLAGGVLTGKYMGVESPPEDSRAASMNYLMAYLEDDGVTTILDNMREIAVDLDLTMNQLAVSWLLAKPYATTVILGGTKPEHFSAIYDVADQELPPEVVGKIDEVSAARVYGPFTNQPQRNAPGVSGTR